MVSPTKPAERCGPPPTRPRQLSAAAVSHRCARRKFFPNPALYFLPSFSLHSPDFLAALKARRPALYAPAFCALLLFGANSAALSAWCQAVPDAPAPASSALTESNNSDSSDPVDRWEGLPVRHISFSGVPADRLTPLSGHLAQAEGAPLIAEDLKKSLRQLYATGLYDNVEVQGTRQQDGLSLVFLGTPRTFIGLVSVDGATGATMNSLLQRATQLEAGTRFTQAKILRAIDQMRASLEDNGYHESSISQAVTPHPDQQLADIAFRVVSGPKARIGKITVTGDSGMSLESFRHLAGLRTGAHVDRDTVNHALDGVLRYFQKQNRMEADVKLESAQYNAATKSVDYRFSASRGPVIKVEVHGAALDPDRIKRLVPIYSEGSVDEDLLNEGNRRLRDYYQRLGYFDATVDHQMQSSGAGQSINQNANQVVDILYTVVLGPRRRVDKVSIDGNHFFSTATLANLLSVHAANILDRHGLYSQALVSADVSAIEAVYKNNGFSKVKVTPETSTPETVSADNPPPAGTASSQSSIARIAPLTVTYHIAEGQQLRVGKLTIDGNDHIATPVITALLNTVPGQMLSPLNLAGDHDAIVTEYYSHGFDQVAVTVAQQPDPGDPSKVDVVFHVEEGEQIFVRNVSSPGSTSPVRKPWPAPSLFTPAIRSTRLR